MSYDKLSSLENHLLDLSEFEHMWDGSEQGWQLVRFDHSVFIVKFHFSESGPNVNERTAAIEFHEPIRENPKLLDECQGFAIAKPIDAKKLAGLRELEKQYDLKLTIIEIPAGDFSVRDRDGIYQSFLIWPGVKYRVPIINKMLGSDVEMVDVVLD